MALLMVHLLAARDWARKHGEYMEEPDFYLGAISPDAIHVRDHDDKSHKNEIHLDNWIRPNPDSVIEYWREHHAPFDIGYGIHVLTDAQWVPRYKRLLPMILKPDGRVNTDIYYRDTYITDFQLYRDRDGGELFRLVERGCPPEGHPLLTRDEFAQWQRMMVDAYHGPCPSQGRAEFIDVAYVDAFLNDCRAMLDETYGRYENE